MASSQSSTSASLLLECAICTLEFSENNFPRILPCSHVYCTACLIDRARRHGRGIIKCPECRQEHDVLMEELNICHTTMKLLEISHNQRKKMKAELQKQKTDHTDSASAGSGQASSSSLQISCTDNEGLLTVLKASMREVSRSQKVLEENIDETCRRQAILQHTMETAKQTVIDRMDQIIRAATEREQELLQSLDNGLEESLSMLTTTEEDLRARQEAHGRFCSEMAEKETALQGDGQADPEEIRRLIMETENIDNTFRNKILIHMKDLSLDTDDDRYQGILKNVSSWGDMTLKQESTPKKCLPPPTDAAQSSSNDLTQ